MKTLYEILEVSENASKEVIEKAYKVLAKKNHPDLQPEEKKAKAEQTMKQINEAYSILSDEIKRQNYNEKLKLEREKQTQNIKNTISNNYQNNQTNTSHNNYQNPMTQEEYEKAKKKYQEQLRKQRKVQEEIQKTQAEYEEKYQRAYEDYLKSLGYKIKYKWTWKNYKDLIITLAILAIICTILWFLPPTHKWIMDFYQSNSIIKTIIDVIGNIFVGIGNAIVTFFSNIF